jgi:hypothetical protein
MAVTDASWGHVGFEDERFALLFADQAGGLGRCGGVAVDHDDPGALAGEQHRGRPSVAPARSDRACPRDQRDLARQATRHAIIP